MVDSKGARAMRHPIWDILLSPYSSCRSSSCTTPTSMDEAFNHSDARSVSLCALIHHPSVHSFQEIPPTTAACDRLRCSRKHMIVACDLSKQFGRKISVYK
jgi:hypothetical protein